MAALPPVPRRLGLSREFMDFLEALRNAVGGDGATTVTGEAAADLAPVAAASAGGGDLAPVPALSAPAANDLEPV